MITLTPKALLGTIAAGAMAVSVASPAQAQSRDRIDGDDIVAGALVIGGLAAIAAILSDDDDDRYDDRYDDRRGYDDRYDSRRGYRDRDYDRRHRANSRNRAERVVQRCVQVAQSEARRAGYRDARVTEIRDVDRERNGFEVKGRIEVRGDRRGGRYNSRYDRRGNNYDQGRFTCKIRGGQVVDIDFDNIRGLR